jgi:hypothetical protein
VRLTWLSITSRSLDVGPFPAALWSAVVVSLPALALSDLPLRRVFSTAFTNCFDAGRSGVLFFLTLVSDELFALCLYPAKLGGCYYEGRRGGDRHEGTKPDLLDAGR